MTVASQSLFGLLVMALVHAPAAYIAVAQELELISRQDIEDGGAQGFDISLSSAISADGRYVAFTSHATNLIPGGGSDTNKTEDVFLHDRHTGSLVLISRQSAADGGAQGNRYSQNPSTNTSGRFTAFASNATNLIPGGGLDTNGVAADIFVFDLFRGSLDLISRQDAADGGKQGNSDSIEPDISSNGRFVSFASEATNLTPGGGEDINGSDFDVFVFDRATNSLELISRQSIANGGAQGDADSIEPDISGDGRFVAFASQSTNLIPGGGEDINGPELDVFVFDRIAKSLELISRQSMADGGRQGNSSSSEPSISDDGRFVAFASQSTNLIPGGGEDLNGPESDIFVFDRKTSSLELISRQGGADGGAQGNSRSSYPSLSANGRFVVYSSMSTNLARGADADFNGRIADVFIFDRHTDTLELVSLQNAADGGAPANGDNLRPSVSALGGFVAFHSLATNLIPGGVTDVNGGAADVFVRRLKPRVTPARGDADRVGQFQSSQ